MAAGTITFRLDAKLYAELALLSRESGRSRGDLIRDAIRRQVALARFERARRALLRRAESKGAATDMAAREV